MGTRYPIRQHVQCFCPACGHEVPQQRSVYPDEIYYTCDPCKHHWTFKFDPNDPKPDIPGGPYLEPPKGWNEDE